MIGDDNYDDAYEQEETRSEDPQWRMLTPKERKLLMKKVFSNPDWYDEDAGTPVFEGGTSNPMFNEIAERVGAPVREVKRYYAAWCNARGLSPGDLMNNNSTERSSSTTNTAGTSYSAPIPAALGISQIQPTPPPLSLQPPPENAGSDASGMWAMMQFLTAQQQMAMQQQQFQSQIQMDQRRLDQVRESELRRESVARDQQFMNQQMSFMRDMTKKSGDDGFFDSDMKGIFKERMVDSMFGTDKDESWRDTVKDVLGSDTLKATVAGLGTAIGGMKPATVPAGYDTPDYNPYAQVQPQQQITHTEPIIQQPPQQYEAPSGVFFSETEEVAQAPPPPQEPPQPEIVTFNEDEYKKILFQAFTEAMGPAANDPKVLQALQSQVEVAVQSTMIEMPEALPNMKLQAMNEKLLLIRNLRDLGMGLMDLRSRTAEGQQPSPILVSAVVGELRKNPEFYKIFATNTYDELMANIEPFKATGAVRQDYEYLLQPATQGVCRPLLEAVAVDSQTKGFPQLTQA